MANTSMFRMLILFRMIKVSSITKDCLLCFNNEELTIMLKVFLRPTSSSSTCNKSIEGFHCI